MNAITLQQMLPSLNTTKLQQITINYNKLDYNKLQQITIN